MGHGLYFYCEHCETVIEHKVHRTRPERYRWDNEHTRYFEFALGRDLEYRKRQRSCGRCGHTVETVEMPFEALGSLIGELDQLRDHVQRNRQASEMAGASSFVALLADVFGTQYSLGAIARLSSDQLTAFKNTVDKTLATLSDANQGAIRRCYGLPLLNVATMADRSDSRAKILIMLKHPSRSRRLRPWLDLLWP